MEPPCLSEHLLSRSDVRPDYGKVGFLEVSDWPDIRVGGCKVVLGVPQELAACWRDCGIVPNKSCTAVPSAGAAKASGITTREATKAYSSTAVPR